MNIPTKARAGIIAGAAVAALAITGIVGSTVANAADSTPSPTATSGQQSTSDENRGTNHVAEEVLTGDTATKVKTAVEAKYPGATIDRMEKDSDGTSVYEAHITKADGTHATVMLDANFTITGEDTRGPGGPGGKGARVAEEALTGDTATKVKTAVEAKYPGATIDRMEKDSDGTSVYEAHITKADGTHATVMLDANFAITGEDTRGPGGPGGRGGHHGPDGDGDGAQAAPSATTTS